MLPIIAAIITFYYFFLFIQSCSFRKLQKYSQFQFDYSLTSRIMYEIVEKWKIIPHYMAAFFLFVNSSFDFVFNLQENCRQPSVECEWKQQLQFITQMKTKFHCRYYFDVLLILNQGNVFCCGWSRDIAFHACTSCML